MLVCRWAAAYGFKVVTFTALGAHMIVCWARLHTNVMLAQVPLTPTVVTSILASGSAGWAGGSVARCICPLVSLLFLEFPICAAGSSRSATLSNSQLPYGAMASLFHFDYFDSTLQFNVLILFTEYVLPDIRVCEYMD